MNVLALNPGSNTLKYKLVGSGEAILDSGFIDGVKGQEIVTAAKQLIQDKLTATVDQIGVRVVHGGHQHFSPELVTPELLQELRDLVRFAPQHLPTDIAVIEAMQAAMPQTPVIAAFDTHFHQTISDAAACCPLGDGFANRYRRLGFHGFAHRYVVGELCRRIGQSATGTRIVSVHLGGGASACAIRDGRSIDTTMGFTPLEGMMMSTRCGDVDAGVVIDLFRQGYSCDEIEELLNRRSGLLGISERSADIRDLEPAAACGDCRAELALQMYSHRCRRHIGGMMAVLGGCDALVFSGALAENSATFRSRMLQGLEGIGLRIDESRNSQAEPSVGGKISHDDSARAIWMIPVDEELEIARSIFQHAGK